MLFPAIVPQVTPLAPADLLKLSVSVVVKIYVQNEMNRALGHLCAHIG